MGHSGRSNAAHLEEELDLPKIVFLSQDFIQHVQFYNVHTQCRPYVTSYVKQLFRTVKSQL